uniref:GPI mannosyltransferase 2 n=1 Tax=Strigamia maritima TaxID=126957 RepID=T1J1J6_STRMM
MAASRRKIWEWAIISRTFLFITEILFNFIIPDHESDGFRTPSIENTNLLDEIVSFMCGGLTHWDGQHFLHIAQYGYTYENNLAFFPLYPFLMKTIAITFGYPLQAVLSYRCVLIISGLFINLMCFAASAEILYELSRCVLKDENLAFRAALLYCMNPASVFFSAIYTESLFACCVFAGMLFYEKKMIFASSICFALSGATRSNGIINCGFPIYHVLHEIFKSTQFKRAKINYLTISNLFKLVIHLCIIVIPFFAHQVYTYKLFCNNLELPIPHKVREYAFQNDLVLPSSDTSPSWCHHVVPSSYNAIQDKYWNVGFLRYYQWKQIPNFLLAAPITIILIATSIRYCARNIQIVRQLGFVIGDRGSESIGIDNRAIFVYLVHAIVQLMLGWLFINVQVDKNVPI